MKKLIGKVTPDERYDIRSIYERINGLLELLEIVNEHEDSTMYNGIVTDLSNSQEKYKHWWKSMAAKYGWESSSSGRWKIDFETCEIYLTIKD